MTLRDRISPELGSILFMVVAPGTIAGLIPFWILRYETTAPFFGAEPFRWFGVALLALGAVLLVETFMRFARQGRGTPAPLYPTEALVITGSYRYVRNPMYVAVVSLILGQAFLFANLAVLVWGLVVWLTVHLFVLGYEEPTLAATFGTQYDAYRKGVRRWIPRLTPWRG